MVKPSRKFKKQEMNSESITMYTMTILPIGRTAGVITVSTIKTICFNEHFNKEQNEHRN